MKSKCELVRNDTFKRKANAEDRFVTSSGKVIYSHYGYKDAMTDEPFDECINCKWFCNGFDDVFFGGGFDE